MKKLLVILLSAVALTAMAQNEVKKVAILPVVDENNSIKEYVKFMLREDIADAINKTPGYIVLERVDLSKVLDEQKFQRTGNVSDEEIKKLGVMSGAQYVLIANAVPVDNQNILISAKIVNVETAIREKSTRVIRSSTELIELEKSCIRVAELLLGNSSGNPSISNKSGTSFDSMQRPVANQDFTETALGINMKMIWVEGGEFMMGCTAGQGNNCVDDGKDVRRVTVDGFYIGMIEVTQSQWEIIMGTNIYQQCKKSANTNPLNAVGASYPMYNVSWEEAMEFCRRLSNKTGRTYTLPTEAQWEFAARGGVNADDTRYAGSNNIDEIAWYKGNCYETAHLCGTKRANSLGLYDMTGNVGEWCKDWKSDNYSYMNNNTHNPTGPSSGSLRVSRGGSWVVEDWYCRIIRRGGGNPSACWSWTGFRVVCIP